jgi:nicotinamide phosphoribosyltransferase
VIIGENMNFENVVKCDEFLQQNGVPINFVFYGVGAGFFKHIDRDYLGFAMKTAFSNGKPRMKFGMTPLKRSIPDIVDIVSKMGDFVVVPEGQNEGLESQYETVYYHDATTEKPHIVEANWNETQERALAQTAHQEVIYLSKEIGLMIKDFEKIYR